MLPAPAPNGDAVPHHGPPGSTAAQLHGWRLILARGLCLSAVIFSLAISILAVRTDYLRSRILDPLTIPAGWTAEARRTTMAELGFSINAYAAYFLVLNLLFVVVFFSVATLVVWRRPADRIALFVAFFLVVFAASWVTNPQLMPPVLSIPVEVLNHMGWLCLLTFFFIFPDGRFVPRWTRWLVIGLLLVMLLLQYLVRAPQPVELLIWPTALAGAAGAQVYRYRRVAGFVQRHQIKWIAFGFTAILITLLAFLIVVLLFPPLSEVSRVSLVHELVGRTIAAVLFLPIPLSIAVALLRYRLWDIDPILNRTLVYSTLTATLALIYISSVVILQALLRPLIGQESPITIVASTLAIAALFQPLRRRIQHTIDRRFYRRKYDSQRVLESFGVRLRQGTDLEVMTQDMLGVIQETLQPTHASLWLRNSRQSPPPDPYRS
jgi:hypothetical protein